MVSFVLKNSVVLFITMTPEKKPKEAALGKDLLVPLMHHDPSDLGSLIQIRFIPKERTLYVIRVCKTIETQFFDKHPFCTKR